MTQQSIWLSPDDEADLRWYYTESTGDMGLRSSFDGFESAMCARDYRHTKNTAPEHNVMYVSKNAHGRRNFVEDKMLGLIDAGIPARIRRVESRLRRLDVCARRTLEAQFATNIEIPGIHVSPILASQQPTAVKSFADVKHRLRKKTNKYDTPLSWIAQLVSIASANPAGNPARILGTIIAQSLDALHTACKAYSNTKY